jgi:hypothetical protein
MQLLNLATKTPAQLTDIRDGLEHLARFTSTAPSDADAALIRRQIAQVDAAAVEAEYTEALSDLLEAAQ